MYQFVEDLKKEQYLNFLKKLKEEDVFEDDKYIYLGIAKDKKLVACTKIIIKKVKKKNVLLIPYGIKTIIDDITLYSFFKKHIVKTAKLYNIQKIQIYDKEDSMLSNVGFKKEKQLKKYFINLKSEKDRTVSPYLSIKKIVSQRDLDKLKEISKNPINCFDDTVSFYVLQLDILTYIDSLKDENIKKNYENVISEFDSNIFLESIEIQKLNNIEALYINWKNYSLIEEEERKNLLFYLVRKELFNDGFKKLILPKKTLVTDYEENNLVLYELKVKSYDNLFNKKQEKRRN